jgi:hypothetical protein
VKTDRSITGAPGKANSSSFAAQTVSWVVVALQQVQRLRVDREQRGCLR